MLHKLLLPALVFLATALPSAAAESDLDEATLKQKYGSIG